MGVSCPHCRFENRGGANFCLQCGGAMEFVCSGCGHRNPSEGRFCEQCGSKRDRTPPVADQLAVVRKYLPQGLAERILFQKDKIEGERRQVTVMFCDMHGFTGLVDRLGPEEAYQTMDRVYEVLIHKIHEFEGTVNELTGDGVMALFGAPIALEDAPQRALQSACAIHQAIAALSAALPTQTIKMRIGINTGPVVVGTLGNDLRVEFKAVGDTVNLAARVEDLAEAGETLVTDTTHQLTEGLFEFEALGSRRVKGKTEPIAVYRVTGPSNRRTRFEVSAERGLTPFVSRKPEMAFMLDRFAKAAAGQGQVYSIVAEAGVGKSRFVHEFKKATASEGIGLLEGKCLSFSKGISYYPIGDMLQSYFEIRGGDGDAAIREKVNLRLGQLGQDQLPMVPYLLELLSVSESGIESIPSSTEARRERMREVLWRLVAILSRRQPLVIIMEDLHWVDKSTENALRFLIDKIASAPVFLVLTYRPDYARPWSARSHHGIINLNRFSGEEGREMVGKVLAGAPVDPGLERFVLEKAEGVPLFIEEFIRSLKKLGYIVLKNDCYGLVEKWQEMAVPSTIHDVVMAKIDALPAAARELLQIGSAFEREFSLELLQRVSDRSEEDLKAALDSLVDSELIFERGPEATPEYGFRHSITKEVVYESVLRGKRRQIHAGIAKALEFLYAENIDEKCEVLAHHFLRDSDCAKAAHYFGLAARKSMRSASLVEAISFNQKRIQAIDKLPPTDQTLAMQVDARTNLGRCYFLMNYMAEAKAAIEPIFEAAVAHNMSDKLAQLHTIKGAYDYMVEEKFDQALAHLEEAVRISEATGDIVSQVISNYQTGLVLAWRCEFDRIHPYFAKAIDIFNMVQYQWGSAVMESIAGFYAYNYRGQVSEGFQKTWSALQHAEASDDMLSKAVAYTIHGISHYFRGSLDQSEDYLTRGAQCSERLQLISFSVLANYWLGTYYEEIGDSGRALARFRSALDCQQKSGLIRSNYHLISLAIRRAEAAAGTKGVHWDSLLQHWERNNTRLHSGSIALLLAELIQLRDGRMGPDAEKWVHLAMEEHDKHKMTWSLAMDHLRYAKMLRQSAQYERAAEALQTAMHICRDCGADGWVERIGSLTAALPRPG